MTKRAIDLAAELPWAIYEPALETILQIAGRETPDAETLKAWKDKMAAPQAVAARQGDPLQDGGSVTVRNGVAVVPISGPIFRYANLFTELSGATSIEMLAMEFRAALESPKVKSILLEIDSPGGQTAGIGEFAAMVRAATAIKPVVAYVGHLAASAAYWIASAASQVVLDKTAALGSIGVIATIQDTSQRDAARGIRTHEIVSSQSPDKRVDVNTESGRGKIQSLVDRMATEFVNDVAQYRGVSPDTVLAEFGQGGLKIGTDAIAAGMADRTGSFEHVLSELAAAGYPGPQQRRAPAGAIQQTTGAHMDKPTIESIGRDQPEIAAHFRNEGQSAAEAAHKTALAAALEAGIKTALEAERARVTAIESLAASYPGHDALIAKAKADGQTVEQTAHALAGAERAKKEAALQNMQHDLGETGVKPGASATGDKRAAVTDPKVFAKQITETIAAEARNGNTISAAQAAALLAQLAA